MESLTSPPVVSIASYLKVGIVAPVLSMIGVSPVVGLRRSRVLGSRIRATAARRSRRMPRSSYSSSSTVSRTTSSIVVMPVENRLAGRPRAASRMPVLAAGLRAARRSRRPATIRSRRSSFMIDQLVDAHAALVAGVVAAVAAPAVVELLAAHLVRRQVQLHQHLGARLELGAAVARRSCAPAAGPGCLRPWR